MRTLILISLLYSFSSWAYECKRSEYSLDVKKNRKELVKIMKEENRQKLFEGLLFELTTDSVLKSAEKAKQLSYYLINTEVNEDQRAFLKLLEISSDLQTSKPKKIDFKEVCEINAKVK